ncbi:hypothetical protein ALC60_06148 [Trachymyrmex zeteki]|uniref:Uncharacterized protein n=1 Tax=Mycetomoellerius zeteki TaxID=64791 RepID=A0A151X3H6_9HYME|nr:hypothetical protein ALC60_06148 [Trachymyrmex zeteki]
MASALSGERFRSYEEIKNWLDTRNWIASKHPDFYHHGIRLLFYLTRRIHQTLLPQITICSGPWRQPFLENGSDLMKK